MKHPTTRAERRHERNRIIARRRFVVEHIWTSFRSREPHEGDPAYMQVPGWYTPPEWGTYSKFNLNCGCRGCHWEKHTEPGKRRQALKKMGSEAACERD